ncbi:VOC family protein [Pseudooceanicola spongiae]|uniref:VOC family protein n=1 Tax=Pseudooceanicola spongiae TaxID=2613965 RepID=A0A7L9WKU4_9RHOB|nr:VOC family protein [Pseudooceanicola spongiae]QOL80327.1 VOC family protein [Pseudooceanicola spongiae]
MSALFDHVTLGVSDIARARAFYNRIMPTLGVPLLWETATMLTYGKDGQDFGLQCDTASARQGTHVAFAAPDRTSVDRFHAEALAAGGQDAGAPGLRPQYQGRYYAAFILDPDGNRIEAVFHAPED